MLKLLFFLAVASFALTTQGQSLDWRVYSSADDRFTVEVPTTCRIVKVNESKNAATLSPDERENLASYISGYEDASGHDRPSKFSILVINGQAAIFPSGSRSYLLEYLGIMSIGDDDDPYPTRVTSIKVNRLEGKEYVWDKKTKVFENGRSNEIFTRGRIFDRGDKIYVIVFKGKNSNELMSPTAKRFLNSLRLQKRKS